LDITIFGINAVGLQIRYRTFNNMSHEWHMHGLDYFIENLLVAIAKRGDSVLVI
jgi:hypothetical protein